MAMFHEKGNYDSLMGEIEHPAVKKKVDGSASGASAAAAPVAAAAAARPSPADPSVERWKKKSAKKELPSLKKRKKQAEPAVEITVDDARKAVLTGLIESNALTVADCHCMLAVVQAAAKAEKAAAKAAAKAEKQAAKAAAKQEADAAKAAAAKAKDAAKAAAKWPVPGATHGLCKGHASAARAPPLTRVPPPLGGNGSGGNGSGGNGSGGSGSGSSGSGSSGSGSGSGAGGAAAAPSRWAVFDFGSVAAATSSSVPESSATAAAAAAASPVLVARAPTRPGVLFDCTADAGALAAAHPVQFRSPNKRAVATLAYPGGAAQAGGTSVRLQRCDSSIIAARLRTDWPSCAALAAATGTTVVVVPGFFDYKASAVSAAAAAAAAGGSSHCVVAWYPNFAHSHLFVAWNSALLAQDELQALEFPLLVSLRLALLREAPAHARTRGRGGAATPVLVQGVQRRCAIDTVTAPSIYGNAFVRASAERVRARVTVLPEQPGGGCGGGDGGAEASCLSNIYAFEAPPSGRGRYTHEQVRDILQAAYSTFRAVVLTGGQRAGPDAADDDDSSAAGGGSGGAVVDEVELHIGYWGCGAYGGNRVLMVLLQLIAARLAGVPHVCMHTAPGSKDGRDAHAAIELLEHAPMCVDAGLSGLVGWVCDKGLKWGVSDGN